MRKLFLLLSLALISGCVVRGTAGYYPSPDPYGQPGYVHYYADGTCWADGAWYAAPCPWIFETGPGYYYWQAGVWYPRHGYVWPYQPGYPPPRYRPPSRPPRYHVPPPRVRDHRTNPPPRGRDHRRRR